MMQQKQLTDALMMAIGQALANTHTATIGRVTAVGATTIDVKPVIQRIVSGKPIEMPVFQKVPPIFLNGGGSHLAMPIAVGDYALLIFTESCFDRWYAGQDNQPPLTLRMHDYSDGFALVGIKPEASAIGIPDVMTLVGDMEYTGNLTITGDLVVNGDIAVSGGDVVADGISLKNHVHPYTWTGTPGSGNTEAPS